VRSLPEALVVDASILISAVLGRSAVVLEDVGARVSLVTSDRTVEEAARRIALGMGRPDLLTTLERLVVQVEVVPVTQLAATMALAASYLRDAAHSRNGATTDAHILALAWQTNADVWSHDRDFAGTGVASWSTINLVRSVEIA
jgi:predicted nucleic acid-binding protein